MKSATRMQGKPGIIFFTDGLDAGELESFAHPEGRGSTPHREPLEALAP